jgi:ribosomal protein S18 acetylase RimI-like enzyme
MPTDAEPPVDVVGATREELVPLIKDGFVGIYRWHAKRTLFRIDRVRAVRSGGGWLGLSMLERLAPEVGYVYYIVVGSAARQRGLGGFLLDDALAIFGAAGVEIVYAAVEEDNAASIALFTSRGFRLVDKQERSYKEGGLGAWGLRSRMMVVSGEVLLGLRLRAAKVSIRPLDTPFPPGSTGS